MKWNHQNQKEKHNHLYHLKKGHGNLHSGEDKIHLETGLQHLQKDVIRHLCRKEKGLSLLEERDHKTEVHQEDREENLLFLLCPLQDVKVDLKWEGRQALHHHHKGVIDLQSFHLLKKGAVLLFNHHHPKEGDRPIMVEKERTEDLPLDSKGLPCKKVVNHHQENRGRDLTVGPGLPNNKEPKDQEILHQKTGHQESYPVHLDQCRHQLENATEVQPVLKIYRFIKE